MDAARPEHPYRAPAAQWKLAKMPAWRGSAHFFSDGERALHQLLSLVGAAQRSAQPSQFAERGGDLGMVGPKRLLLGGDCASIQRLGFREAALLPVQPRQVVERGAVIEL